MAELIKKSNAILTGTPSPEALRSIEDGAQFPVRLTSANLEIHTRALECGLPSSSSSSSNDDNEGGEAAGIPAVAATDGDAAAAPPATAARSPPPATTAAIMTEVGTARLPKAATSKRPRTTHFEDVSTDVCKAGDNKGGDIFNLPAENDCLAKPLMDALDIARRTKPIAINLQLKFTKDTDEEENVGNEKASVSDRLDMYIIAKLHDESFYSYLPLKERYAIAERDCPIVQATWKPSAKDRLRLEVASYKPKGEKGKAEAKAKGKAKRKAKGTAKGKAKGTTKEKTKIMGAGNVAQLAAVVQGVMD